MMRLQNKLACAAALIAPLFAQAAAEDGATNDEIIVTGLRLPTPLAETGSSVSVITADDIELKGYAFALDALASAPGVTVNQNGAFGGVATVRIRGAGADQTLVLLDGVPMGDPSSVGGGYDFSVLDAADIDRIEILKGAQSTLWGSDAIGGVVNIVTKKPEEGFGGTLFAEGGSYHTYRGGASLSGAGEAGDFRLSASGVASDGVSKADAKDGNTESDGYDGLTFSGRGGLNLAHDIRLDAFARYMDGETDIDGFPPPDYTLADNDDTSKTRQVTTGGALHVPLFDGALKNMVQAGYTDIKRTGVYSGYESIYKGDRLVLRYQGTAQIDKRNRLAFGAEREKIKAAGEETTTKSLFGLYELKPVETLTLSAGLRHDDHSRFGSATTARATAAFSPTSWATLKGSWGEGFKAPTIFQLTASYGALPPNADLQPETSEAWDAGVDLAGGVARLSVTYFYRDTENLIIYAATSRYENLDATTADGVETAVEFFLTDNLTLSANHAYIDARDADTGARQIRIPRHSGDLTLTYRSGKVSGSTVLRYNGKELDNAYGGEVDEWLRVDLAASYALNDRIELYGRIENLFDAHYQEVLGYGTPGLSGYGGVRLSF